MWAPTREVSSIPAIAGYLAFTAATLLAVVASGTPMARSAVIVGLLAVSLPALGAWLYIDSVDWVGSEPASRLVRQAVIALGLACSGAGFLTTIWSFSWLAALVIVLEMAVLYLAISGLSFLRDDPDMRQ
ncbi:MAG TPA: hypothetical protein VFO08_20975 [Methylomirabilota bacterium]|jgi:hypothetical protein|nr:hypothetical protein [Methylomirabilota bacterium]